MGVGASFSVYPLAEKHGVETFVSLRACSFDTFIYGKEQLNAETSRPCR